MQCGLAAITLQLDAGFGPVDQLPGLGLVERGSCQSDILHQFDIDAAGTEQHYRAHLGIERCADHQLKFGLDLLRDQDALERRLVLEFLDAGGDVGEGFPDLGCAVEVQHHAADIRLVQDVRADHLGDHGENRFSWRS